MLRAGIAFGGCCYSIGYGSMMKPCCLETRVVADDAACNTNDEVLGGKTEFTNGACPLTADDAAELMSNSTTTGCCFEIIVDSNSTPQSIKTEKSKKGECSYLQPHSGPNLFGWSTACPLTVVEAQQMIAKQNLNNATLGSYQNLAAMPKSEEVPAQNTFKQSGGSSSYMYYFMGVGCIVALAVYCIKMSKPSYGNGYMSV